MKFVNPFNFGLNKSTTTKKTPLHQGICQIPIWFLLTFLFWSPSDGGKVLVIPLDGSHWLSMRLVLERLHQRGHEIVVIAPDVRMRIKPSIHYTLKTFAVPYGEEYMKEEVKQFGQKAFSQQPFLAEMTEMIATTRHITTRFFNTCKQLLYNKEIIAYLEGNQFDVVFTVPVSPCGQILAEHLSLPSVYYSRGFHCGLEATQCPNLPSYVPEYFTGYTDHMDFNQRVKNFLISRLGFLMCSLLYSSFNILSTEFLQREVTVHELYSQASIWLLRYDFAFEYPRPLMPNMVLIGGIHCEKKAPLIQVGIALNVTHTYS
uniref:UDP-glucuronosyltransferase 1A1-like n=1 Tax=Euleptes europaea TaxID=460621 RepID=UPI00253F69D5|nr:UDP-glucuronosyltransferase 1A1-like [Euleptes europaea]